MKKIIQEFRYVFSAKEKWNIVYLLVLIIIGSFLELLGVAVFMPFISLLMNYGHLFSEGDTGMLARVYFSLGMSDNDFIILLAMLISLVYILKNLYLAFMQNNILTFSYRTRMNIATRLLTTYIREPYTFHLKKNISEFQRALQLDAQQFMLLLNAMLQLIAEVTVVLAIVLYLFTTSKAITVMIAVFLVLFVGVFMVVSKKVSGRVGKENEHYQAKLNQWINQGLGGVKEVKVLNREDFFINAYNSNYKKLIKGAKLNEMLATIPKYIVETVSICGMLVAIAVKIKFGRSEDISLFIPQLSAFAVASFRLLPSMGKLNAYITNINYCAPSLDNIYNDLKEIDGFVAQESVSEDPANRKSLTKELIIDDVVYRYPDADTDVINHVSFAIPRGKTCALIGASGAGKTTLADIILGILEPTHGRIMVDDWETKTHPTSWHSLLGYIPQTIYLMDDTIRKNIAFGIEDENIDDAAVNKALKQAQLKDFVDSLPSGIDTFVGDRGVRLSGGQRQRIGIARALYHDPEILVLDEATSALDNETETAVMEAIDSLQGNKTIIIIAHRLSTIKNADIIYEVSEGKILPRTKESLGIG